MNYRSSVWHLPFILKVNGSIVTPPSINSTTFEMTFNTTTQWKQKFTLVHTDEVTDKQKVFSVLFNHKVSEPAKEEIKKAIIATFVQQHPGMLCLYSFLISYFKVVEYFLHVHDETILVPQKFADSQPCFSFLIYTFRLWSCFF